MEHVPFPRFSGTFATVVRPSVLAADHHHILQLQTVVSSLANDHMEIYHVL